MTLGETIRAKRKKYGWAQHEVATLIGVSQQTVAFWEKDRMRPHGEHAERLYVLLRLAVHVVITIEDLDRS